ncbi:hypothetical protein Tco_0538740, partial [Tanacetum coccineum]
MEEMLNKFIDEGKREHEEIRAFIYDFPTPHQFAFQRSISSNAEVCKISE